MNRFAFVTAAPVTGRVPATALKSSFASRPETVRASNRRTRGIVMADKRRRIEGILGFTTFAENFNGRMAMMGFVLALLTEVFTGHTPLSQVTALVRNVFGDAFAGHL